MTFKKIVIGLALVAILCGVAGAGYSFGKYLKHQDASSESQVISQ